MQNKQKQVLIRGKISFHIINKSKGRLM